MQQLYAWMFLVLLFALFPSESTEIVLILTLKAKVCILNCILFLRSYWIYRKLARELGQHGFEAPPFKFIPIQDRYQ